MTYKAKKMGRRTFLKTTGIGSASLAITAGLAGKLLTADAAQRNSSADSIMPTRILGNTGVPVSILSLGGAVDWTINHSLLRMSFNMGIDLWDTSPGYENGKSELGIGQYFEKYPEDRKKILVSTKFRVAEPKGMIEQLNSSLERLKIDYIDLYYLINPEKPEILSPEIKAWAEQRKKEGKIRFFGFAIHSNMAQMLMHASNLGWIDAILTSYNYNIMNDDGIKRSIDACHRAGIGFTAMKSQGLRYDEPYRPLGEVKDEDLKVTESFMSKGYTPYQAKLKAIWTDERIASCLSQITNLTILKDNVAAATDTVQLSKSDMDTLTELAKANRGFYCQGCMSCESAMGSESRIHDILRYMMYYNGYGERDEARKLFRALPASVKNGLAFKDYSPAENACPRNIAIGKMMGKALKLLG